MILFIVFDVEYPNFAAKIRKFSHISRFWETFLGFISKFGYKGSVEYSKEDNCLFGKMQGLSKDLIVYEGQTLDELYKDFEEGIDRYIEGDC